MDKSKIMWMITMFAVFTAGCGKPTRSNIDIPEVQQKTEILSVDEPKKKLELPPLAGYWPFNGDSRDRSGANINLTAVGVPQYVKSLSRGLGAALALDGDDGMIGVNFVKFTGVSATVVIWAKADDLQGSWNTLVKNWGTQMTGQFSLSIGPGNKETLHFHVAKSSPPNHKVFQGTSPKLFPRGEWVHCAAILDANAKQLTLYINGKLVVSSPYTAPIDPESRASGLGIGVKPNNDGTGVAKQNEVGYWIGLIDEVGLYNSALSADQVKLIYRNALEGIQLDGTSLPAIKVQKRAIKVQKRIPENAKEFQGHKYMIYNIKTNIEDAKMRCKDMGGYLVNISTLEEKKFISLMLKNHKYIKGGYFIGAERKSPSEHWQWTSGEKFNLKWAGANRVTDGDCARITRDGQLWRVRSSSSSCPFICEWE